MNYAYITNVYPGYKKEEVNFAKELIKESTMDKYNSIEGMENTAEYNEGKIEDKQETNKDNLHYYPYKIDNINIKPRQEARIENVERFERIEGFEKTEGCDVYSKHMTSCAHCKDTFTKQFRLDNDRLQNQEYIELISYIAFGIFILILFDNLQNGKS